MKKILKRVFLIVLCVIVAAGAAIYFFLTSGEKDIENLIVTDAAGSTYRVHIDEDKNTTYAIVTDEQGNVWGADFDGDTVGSTREQLNGIYSPEDIPPVSYTGQHMDYTANSDDYMGQIDNPPTPGNQGGQENPPANTPQAYRIQKYQELFAGGRYLITVTTVEGKEQETITMAVKNGNIYAGMDVDGLTVQMIYMAQNKTMYMLLDFLKKYCEVPQEALGEELDMSALAADFEIKALGEITVSETELNGNKVICEKYTSSDGSEVSYYFDQNDMLVRRDWKYPNGTVDTMVFSQITTEVDDSLFQIPDGYGYLNISWLLKNM